MKAGMQRMKSNGQKPAFYFDESQTHFSLMADMNECIDF